MLVAPTGDSGLDEAARTLQQLLRVLQGDEELASTRNQLQGGVRLESSIDPQCGHAALRRADLTCPGSWDIGSIVSDSEFACIDNVESTASTDVSNARNSTAALPRSHSSGLADVLHPISNHAGGTVGDTAAIFAKQTLWNLFDGLVRSLACSEAWSGRGDLEETLYSVRSMQHVRQSHSYTANHGAKPCRVFPCVEMLDDHGVPLNVGEIGSLPSLQELSAVLHRFFGEREELLRCTIRRAEAAEDEVRSLSAELSAERASNDHLQIRMDELRLDSQKSLGAHPQVDQVQLQEQLQAKDEEIQAKCDEIERMTVLFSEEANMWEQKILEHSESCHAERLQFAAQIQQKEHELEALACAAAHRDDISELHRQLQAKEEDMHALRTTSSNEISALRVQLHEIGQELHRLRSATNQQEDTVGQLKLRDQGSSDLKTMRSLPSLLQAPHQCGPIGKVHVKGPQNLAQKFVLAQQDVANLRNQLNQQTLKCDYLARQQEKDVEDYIKFLHASIDSSPRTDLTDKFDLSTADFLGMGNYGYVLICSNRSGGEKSVLKLQSQRWVAVSVKEWAHGSALKHPNIVEHIEVFFHRDFTHELGQKLADAFDAGVLKGRRPRSFPASYCCMALEYMNHGTVQFFSDRGLLSASCLAAIVRQVASALAFMHRHKCTHNDVKPDNILLREALSGGHLVAKLADLGLAEHSVSREQDHELFGYTVWCLGLGRKFERCPSSDTRAHAIEEFRSSALCTQSQSLWNALSEMIIGLWQGKLDMSEIEHMLALQNHEVQLPSHTACHASEEHARREVARRSVTLEHRLFASFSDVPATFPEAGDCSDQDESEI